MSNDRMDNQEQNGNGGNFMRDLLFVGLGTALGVVVKNGVDSMNEKKRNRDQYDPDVVVDLDPKYW